MKWSRSCRSATHTEAIQSHEIPFNFNALAGRKQSGSFCTISGRDEEAASDRGLGRRRWGAEEKEGSQTGVLQRLSAFQGGHPENCIWEDVKTLPDPQPFARADELRQLSSRLQALEVAITLSGNLQPPPLPSPELTEEMKDEEAARMKAAVQDFEAAAFGRGVGPYDSTSADDFARRSLNTAKTTIFLEEIPLGGVPLLGLMGAENGEVAWRTAVANAVASLPPPVMIDFLLSEFSTKDGHESDACSPDRPIIMEPILLAEQLVAHQVAVTRGPSPLYDLVNARSRMFGGPKYFKLYFSPDLILIETFPLLQTLQKVIANTKSSATDILPSTQLRCETPQLAFTAPFDQYVNWDSSDPFASDLGALSRYFDASLSRG
ncbi:hypothetical protein P7C70_g4496, partial [Phenoliferia sp. Uapishka_3]